MTLYKIPNLLFFILLASSYTNAIAQQHTLLSKDQDTLLYDIYTGKEKFQYYFNEDSSEVRHGKYSFNSDLIKEFKNSLGSIYEMEISGHFYEGVKHKTWSYTVGEYDTEITGLKKGWELSLDYKLNGVERDFIMNFDRGIPDGKWEIKERKLINSRFQRQQTVATIHYFKGLIINSFRLNKETEFGLTKIEGKVDELGFFDGTLILEFENDGEKLKETREYDRGFLLSLECINTENNTVKYKQEYEQVSEKLRILKDTSKKVNYEISNQGFGVEFDNGFKENHEKLTIQQRGNNVLTYFFNRFNKFIELSPADSVVKPEYNLTRRFKYVYPETDDSLVQELRPLIDNLHEKYYDFTNSPKFRLQKQKSDSLALSYAFMMHTKSKIELIDTLIEKVETGYFDFKYRPNYYKNGVAGLKEADTITYEYDGKEKQFVYELEKKITTPNELLINLKKTLREIENKASAFYDYAQKKIVYFEEQDKIDSLDYIIVNTKDRVDSLYGQFTKQYPNKEIEDMPLGFKIYKSINNRLIKSLEKDYLNYEEFDPKFETGSELACILLSLETNFSDFNQIEKLPAQIDSTFTIYRRNPFDNRLFESRILGNIEKGGERLLRHYVEGILRTTDCETITQNIHKINRLIARLRELAERNDDDVKTLNRFMRRENVPVRIERFLGL